MDIHNLSDVEPFITKDGSEIRELLAHRNSSVRNQSLAEARIAPGSSTTPHTHPKTEEIYYILEGRGRMQVGDEVCIVGANDAVAIPPGQWHQITNVGSDVLRFLCCCAPGYENDDTVLDPSSHVPM
jgi:mannose-6-phosphate isomerase-like protein (cupin superfamily)